LTLLFAVMTLTAVVHSVEIGPPFLPLGNYSSDGQPSYCPDGRLIFVRNERIGGGPHWDFADWVCIFAYKTLSQLSVSAGYEPGLSVAGIIVGVYDTEAGSTINVLDPQGRLQRLTSGEYTDRSPTWSPDGSQIAFSSNRSGSFDLWIIAGTGGTPTQLTEGEADDLQPAWSRDGSAIAFVSDRGGSRDIWAISATGGAAQQVTQLPGEEGNPTWSPNGDLIAFSAEVDGNVDVWVVRVATGEVSRVTSSPFRDAEPTWSPDGSAIVFSSDGQLRMATDLRTVGVNSASWTAVKALYR